MDVQDFPDHQTLLPHQYVSAKRTAVHASSVHQPSRLSQSFSRQKVVLPFVTEFSTSTNVHHRPEGWQPCRTLRRWCGRQVVSAWQGW